MIFLKNPVISKQRGQVEVVEFADVCSGIGMFRKPLEEKQMLEGLREIHQISTKEDTE